MIRSATSAALAAALLLSPLPAAAEYLDPDWSTLKIEGVEEPDWFAGENEGNFVGMCTGCEQMMVLQVQVLNDDGTGGRIRSGETTAETYTELGQANANRLGGDTAYYGTEDISFGPGVGFVTSARTGLGDYASTYQLWSDGKQLIVKVYGKDQAAVERTAEQAFTAAAPLTFR